MFTGLVEEQAQVVALAASQGGWRLQLTNPFRDGDVVLGESIAVSGCCLTVAAFDSNTLWFDLLEETLKRTSFGLLNAGNTVNIERALKANGRLGGHFVQGHIDAVLPVASARVVGSDLHLEFPIDPACAGFIVEKGSIALNGVSLTVGKIGSERFDVWLIPHTRSQTNLGKLEEGDLVNVEYDVLAKYVKRQLDLQKG